MQKTVPFFANTRDNTHCYQASMRMILKYFLPAKNFTWKQLETLSAKKKGKWTWATQMLINLQKMGFEVKVIDAFDIDTFIKDGNTFLLKIWGKEMAEAQIKYSDIPQERRLLKIYRKLIDVEKRSPTLKDIKRFLEEGYLVECGVNSAILNKRKGYAGHSVVIYACDKKYVYLHDPGLPPRPNRKVTHAHFNKAWMISKDGNGLTAIRLASSH